MVAVNYLQITVIDKKFTHCPVSNMMALYFTNCQYNCAFTVFHMAPSGIESGIPVTECQEDGSHFHV